MGCSGTECYLLHIDNSIECDRIRDLSECEDEDAYYRFSQCAPVCSGSYVYNSDDDGRIHLYSKSSNEWMIVK